MFPAQAPPTLPLYFYHCHSPPTQGTLRYSTVGTELGYGRQVDWVGTRVPGENTGPQLWPRWVQLGTLGHQAAGEVHGFGTTRTDQTAHPRRIVTIATCQAAQSLSWPGPAPLSSQLPAVANHTSCKVISLCVLLDRGHRQSRLTAAHHAIPAAMWTVSLVKSNHLSGKQPVPASASPATPRPGNLCSVMAAPHNIADPSIGLAATFLFRLGSKKAALGSF